ncbi:MAG: pilus assembly protein PilP [Pontibacterium sp.]
MRAAMLLMLSTLVSGCIVWVEDAQDLTGFINKTKARPAGKIDSLPEYKPYQSFVYEGSSLREPFRPLQPMQAVGSLDAGGKTGRREATGLMPDESRMKDYLEDFSLDDLVMVGTIKNLGSNTLWALVKDTKNAVHRVSVGSHMGLDFGEVTSIGERKLELVEIVSNGRGGWMQRPRVLALDERKKAEKK